MHPISFLAVGGPQYAAKSQPDGSTTLDFTAALLPVVSIGSDTPPTPVPHEVHVAGPNPNGDWAGWPFGIMRVAEDGTWQPYPPGGTILLPSGEVRRWDGQAWVALTNNGLPPTGLADLGDVDPAGALAGQVLKLGADGVWRPGDDVVGSGGGGGGGLVAWSENKLTAAANVFNAQSTTLFTMTVPAGATKMDATFNAIITPNGTGTRECFVKNATTGAIIARGQATPLSYTTTKMNIGCKHGVSPGDVIEAGVYQNAGPTLQATTESYLTAEFHA